MCYNALPYILEYGWAKSTLYTLARHIILLREGYNWQNSHLGRIMTFIKQDSLSCSIGSENRCSKIRESNLEIYVHAIWVSTAVHISAIRESSGWWMGALNLVMSVLRKGCDIETSSGLFVSDCIISHKSCLSRRYSIGFWVIANKVGSYRRSRRLWLLHVHSAPVTVA